MANTIIKNRTAKIPTKSGKDYSYQYTDLASINKWLDENGLDYYQTIETCESNGKDYIMTYRYINGEWEEKPIRGCQVVDSVLIGNSNPVQQYGSSLTYVRRYSLCLAFGLAMEDTDAAELSKPENINMTKEEAENYTLEFGKYKGKKLSEVGRSYINWLLNNENTDPKVLKAIELLTGEVPKTDEEMDKQLEKTQKLMKVLVDKGIDEERVIEHYKVKNLNDLTEEQIDEMLDNWS